MNHHKADTGLKYIGHCSGNTGSKYNQSEGVELVNDYRLDLK